MDNNAGIAFKKTGYQGIYCPDTSDGFEDKNVNFAIELIPTPDRIYFPVYDYGQPLTEAIHQANWWQEKAHTVVHFPIDMISENPCSVDIIPVGTPAFVKMYIRRIPGYEGFDFTRISLPEELRDGEFLYCNTQQQEMDMTSQLSEKSRWRVFVYEDTILDCRCFVGDGFSPPDKKQVRRFIEKWKGNPQAMYVDIIVMENEENRIMDAGNFICCHLYGFQNRYLPAMFSAGYRYERKCWKQQMKREDISLTGARK